MTDKPIATAAEALRVAAAGVGGRTDDPVVAVLDRAADLSIALEKAFPIDRQDFARLVRAELRGSVAGMLQATGWAGIAICAGTLAVGIALGFAGCWALRDGAASVTASQLQAAFSDGTSGAVWLAAVAKNNDLAGLAKQCASMRYEDSGGRACSILLWEKAPPARR